ncbi:MAG: ATP-binding cassette domain-containing protein [Propionibacteriaceae bacterium]|jgi:oligopeptide/dipeptide ABC transporter ATP-binding protein|nr:ATP-binding cassette domain-containing protein [Propionibacteriaceae bacterium]
MTAPLIEVEDLAVTYRNRGRRSVLAVDGVSLAVDRGRTLGLVGESGSGKSTIGSVMLGLVAPSQGRVSLDGRPASWRTRAERAGLARRVQAVFQDPFGSMNPTRKIGQTMTEMLRYNLRLSPAAVAERVERALTDVGMRTEALDRYPSQFSGGQLQRLAIARALVVEPDFVVCDEAVSSLDLSVQAQVINLLAGLAKARGLAYLFISHDLTVVTHLSDQVAVLYAGQVVELGPAAAMADHPRHPYTQALVLAAPIPDPAAQAARRASRWSRAGSGRPGSAGIGSGSPPATTGCRWAPRCPFAVEQCRLSRPDLLERTPGWSVACHVTPPDSE